MKIGGVLN
jgi:pre-mRNA-splicing factor ATP-dependent RNA helicase DHX38/PRP16